MSPLNAPRIVFSVVVGTALVAAALVLGGGHPLLTLLVIAIVGAVILPVLLVVRMAARDARLSDLTAKRIWLWLVLTAVVFAAAFVPDGGHPALRLLLYGVIAAVVVSVVLVLRLAVRGMGR